MQKNLGGMLKTITELQKRSDAAQKKLAATVFEGTAAQGLVKVEMTGAGEIKRVTIAPTVMTEDADTVADLITVAAAEAFKAKEALAKSELGSLAAGLLPMGFKLPGLG